jgi:hypothetical protein
MKEHPGRGVNCKFGRMLVCLPQPALRFQSCTAHSSSRRTNACQGSDIRLTSYLPTLSYFRRDRWLPYYPKCVPGHDRSRLVSPYEASAQWQSYRPRRDESRRRALRIWKRTHPYSVLTSLEQTRHSDRRRRLVRLGWRQLRACVCATAFGFLLIGGEA